MCNVNIFFKMKRNKRPSVAALRHQVGAADAAVGDAAGPHQHAVPGPTDEVAAARHGAVVATFGAPQLQSQPESRPEVGGAQVANHRHLVGAAEQHLHADPESDLLAIRWTCGVAQEPVAQGAAAPSLGVGATPGGESGKRRNNS